MIQNKHQIDAVITWLDGNERSHREKRLEILYKESNKRKNEVTTGRDITRFIDNGELKYCITSIRKFAPWIRKIHLVTDNQIPLFLTPKLQKEFNIEVVDHTKIFESYEWALPTFNSRTIESALWRIPGLAPNYIYFNDDFVITRPVKPSDFFNDDKVVLRGKWNTMMDYGPLQMKLNKWFSYAAKSLFGITRSMHLLQQIRSAQLAEFSGKYYRAPHVPHPIRTNTLKTFFEKNPVIFKENIKYRFRNTDQFSSIFLANHLKIRKNNAVLKNGNNYLMINGETDFALTVNRKLNKIANGEVLFVCLQGFEKFNAQQRRKIHQTLRILLEMENYNIVLSGAEARL